MSYRVPLRVVPLGYPIGPSQTGQHNWGPTLGGGEAIGKHDHRGLERNLTKP